MKENERQRDRERGREQIVGPVTKSVPSKQSKTCGEYLRCVCVCVRVRECVCVSVRKRARERLVSIVCRIHHHCSSRYEENKFLK